MADKSVKAGRNKDKCAKYKAHKTREKNKLKRVLQSSGFDAARLYARKNGVETELTKLANKER